MDTAESAKELEPGGLEVTVEGERMGEPLALHDLEAHGVGERTALLGKTREPIRLCVVDELRRGGESMVGGVVEQARKRVERGGGTGPSRAWCTAC